MNLSGSLICNDTVMEGVPIFVPQRHAHGYGPDTPWHWLTRKTRICSQSDHSRREGKVDTYANVHIANRLRLGIS